MSPARRPGPGELWMLGACLLLLLISMATDRPEPDQDVCDSYPETAEPDWCARDHWAN